jgi:hypothetical protein
MGWLRWYGLRRDIMDEEGVGEMVWDEDGIC